MISPLRNDQAHGSSERPAPPLPGSSRPHGELVSDPVSIAAAAQDFGHVVSHVPRAVLRPVSGEDIAAVVRESCEQGTPVAARGHGHSTFGQAQVTGGIVVDMRTLRTVHQVDSDRVVVDAGVSWRELLAETLRHGLTPPVLTDYLGLTVGGTLSAGGIGGTSHRYGTQTDTVLELDVVTGDGTTHTCDPGRNENLFHAVLAGHGQCGIITRATLRLVRAPDRVRRFKLRYRDATALAGAQRRILRESRFDHLGGGMRVGDQGWRYELEAGRYYSSPERPDDTELTTDLGHLAGTEEIDDLPYADFATRLDVAEAHLRNTGEWSQPHPSWNVFLPDSETDRFIEDLAAELTAADLGTRGLVVLYPLLTERLRTRLFRAPGEPVVFVIELLRLAPADDDVTLQRMIAGNRHWYERARALGGVAYPVGTIPLTKADWRAHFGAREPDFSTAKRRYDPHNILSPGHGIY